MKIYKIYYKDSEGIINEYDRLNYIDKTKAEDVITNIKEQFPDKEFNIYEIEIK